MAYRDQHFGQSRETPQAPGVSSDPDPDEEHEIPVAMPTRQYECAVDECLSDSAFASKHDLSTMEPGQSGATMR
jgi:hypothetical protein